MNKGQKGFSIVEVLVTITVIGIIVGVLAFVYNAQKNNSDDTPTNTATSTTSTENTAQATNATDQTLDQQVLAALKAYCNANVDPATKQPFILTVGKSGKNQKEVLYSSDKKFASVNAVCSTDGTTEGSGSAYYFKYVNDS